MPFTPRPLPPPDNIMNKQRLQRANILKERLQIIQEELEEIIAEEESYKDNIPENMGRRFELAEEALESMNDTLTNLTEAIDALESL